MSIAEEEREGQGSNEPAWIRYVDFSNVQVKKRRKKKPESSSIYLSNLEFKPGLNLFII